MTSFTACVLRRAVKSSLILWIFVHYLVTCSILLMPVVTRSQARTLTSSSNKPLKPTTITTSLISEPLESVHNTTTTIIHSTSLITEPLLENGTPILPSTSLIIERSNHHLSSHDCNTTSLPLITTSTNISSSLDFPNSQRDHHFEISNEPNFENFKLSLDTHQQSHNSSISSFSIMADDVDDSYNSPEAVAAHWEQNTHDLHYMNNLFAAITAHITMATQQISKDFQQVVDTNDDFKWEVRHELDEMKQFLAEQKRLLQIDQPVHGSSDPDTMPSNAPQVIPSSSPSGLNSNVVNSSSSVSSVHSGSLQGSDMQTQLMVMLSESFTKLSTALQEKSDPKTDWP